MNERRDRGSASAGQQRVVLPTPAVRAALRQRPLLRGLLAAGAGYFPKAAGHLRRRPAGLDQAVLIYCVKGSGWCELAGRRHRVREGDLLVLPPGTPYSYGANPADAWTIHWIRVAGASVPDYLKELGTSPANPVLWVGEDLQLTLLFHEVLTSLERGSTYRFLLHAAHALGHLLAVAIEHRHQRGRDGGGGFQRIGKCIEYMSEHIDQPLRVSRLAALANLSPAHFTVLFKAQTGSSPRDYLQLLRSHRACQLLRTTALPVKEIAAVLGYQDQFHFSRAFKASNGVSPSEYRLRPPG